MFCGTGLCLNLHGEGKRIVARRWGAMDTGLAGLHLKSGSLGEFLLGMREVADRGGRRPG